jgi:hypothetical protein
MAVDETLLANYYGGDDVAFARLDQRWRPILLEFFRKAQNPVPEVVTPVVMVTIAQTRNANPAEQYDVARDGPFQDWLLGVAMGKAVEDWNEGENAGRQPAQLIEAFYLGDVRAFGHLDSHWRAAITDFCSEIRAWDPSLVASLVMLRVATSAARVPYTTESGEFGDWLHRELAGRALYAGWRGGDKTAFDVLDGIWRGVGTPEDPPRGRLWKFFKKKGCSDAESQDLAQEVMFKVARSHYSERPAETFAGWMNRIAETQWHDHHSRKKCRIFRSPSYATKENQVAEVVWLMNGIVSEQLETAEIAEIAQESCTLAELQSALEKRKLKAQIGKGKSGYYLEISIWGNLDFALLGKVNGNWQPLVALFRDFEGDAPTPTPGQSGPESRDRDPHLWALLPRYVRTELLACEVCRDGPMAWESRSRPDASCGRMQDHARIKVRNEVLFRRQLSDHPVADIHQDLKIAMGMVPTLEREGIAIVENTFRRHAGVKPNLAERHDLLLVLTKEYPLDFPW